MMQAQILELLEELRRELGLAMILITHDLSVLAETCERVAIMYAGQIAEPGPVGRLFATRSTRTRSGCCGVPGRRRPARARRADPRAAAGPGQRCPGCRFEPRCHSRSYRRLRRARRAGRRRPGAGPLLSLAGEPSSRPPRAAVRDAPGSRSLPALARSKRVARSTAST